MVPNDQYDQYEHVALHGHPSVPNVGGGDRCEHVELHGSLGGPDEHDRSEHDDGVGSVQLHS